MRRFRDLPIRQKLTFFIILVSGLALTLAIIAVITFPPPQRDSHTFQGRNLILFRTVISNGEPIGAVYLHFDLVAAYARVPHYTIILVIVVLALLMLALILSNALQRIISAPILRLTQAARLITERKDYSVRAVKESDDEIG